MRPASLPLTPAQVEELKCVVRLLPVMLTLIIYNSVYAQVRAVGGNMHVPWAGSVHVLLGTRRVFAMRLCGLAACRPLRAAMMLSPN